MSTLSGSTLYMKQSGTTIQYSTDNSSWTNVGSWPITLGTASATLKFTTDLSFNSMNQYFKMGAASQTIDGSYNIVYVNNVAGYYGLVKNGDYAYPGTSLTSYIYSQNNAYSNCTIKNISVMSVSSSLLAIANSGSTSEATGDNKPGPGWIAQIYYGLGATGNTIDFCSANAISNTGYWLKNGGSTASTGASLILGGSIVGYYSKVDLNRCCVIKSTTGYNGSYCGALVAYGYSGTITNCFTDGMASSVNSEAGLIAGSRCTSAKVYKSYSTGAIGSGNGGIFGSYSNTCLANNCYALGSYSGTSNGVYAMPTSNTSSTTTKCYALNGGTWSDTTASSSLDNSGNDWTDVSLNSSTVAWKLSAFTRDLYSSSTGTNVTSVTSILSGTHTYYIVSISVNSGTAVATYTGISISSSTGTLTFSGSLASGTYAVKVMALNSVTSCYYFQTYTNTISTYTAPTISSSSTASVSENTSTSTAVYTVAASGGTGSLTYSISGGLDAALFSINSSTGAVTFKSSPNYESPTDSNGDNVYVITVAVTDTTSTTVTKSVSITVTNVNESPSITSGATASVSENISTSTTVYTVTATDPDASTTITYSISGGSDASLFNIGSSTGIVTFKTSPNYEAPTDSNADNVYVITVRASDGSLYDEKTVSITVTNVNESPSITSGATASVSENISTSTTVYTVTATDPDASTTITYSISGGSDASLFNIGSSTGIVTFKTSPNYEAPTDSNADNVYVITVRASDGSLYDEKTVSITVTNVNEAATITGTSTGSITETNATQSVSGTLTVSDPDAGQSVFIAQTDVSGNNSYGKFTINTSGSWTYTMNNAHNEFVSGQAYTDSITVSSSDGTATQLITVTITGSNDLPTISGVSTGSITETNAAQTVTGSLSISDPDNGQSAFIAQTSVSGTNRYGKFSIDTSGNWSYTMNNAHNEFVSAQTYTDSITVTSNDGTTTQLITVTMTGTNDTATITGTYTGSITETDVIQSVSGSLSISDQDTGESVIVTQTDVSGNNEYGNFSIDASGNWSYTMNSPHNEFTAGEIHTDSITVTSIDGTATKVITVTIIGTNDIPIITGAYIGSITQTDVTQNVSGTLYISDADAGSAYFVAQTNVSGNNAYGKFTVDASGNWTYTMNSPHTEFAANQTYTDSIIVHSNDGSNTQVITVTMTGINDAPIITSAEFVRISADDTTVYTVTAVDPDIGTTLVYSISSGSDASLFNIDSSTGVITFKSTPSSRVYNITVKVSDGSLYAEKNVAIMVLASRLSSYPLITTNQTTITTSSIIYGDLNISDLSVASGVELYLASGSTLTFQSGSFQGTLSGAGSLLKSGTGELTLNSSNADFTGVLQVTEGTVSIETADALGSGSIALGTTGGTNATTLKLNFTGPTTISNAITASSTGTNLVQNTSLYTVTLSGTLSKDGTTLTLSGDFEIPGTIEGTSANSDVVITSDTVVYTSGSTTDYNGPTTIEDGASLTLQDGVSVPNSDVTVQAGGMLIIQNSSMPTSVTANTVRLESSSIMNLSSGYLKTNSLAVSETITGGYISINLIPGNSAIIETVGLNISSMLEINISGSLSVGTYDLIHWTGTKTVTGSVMINYTGTSMVSIAGAFNNTSKKYTITVTEATINTTYAIGGTISGNTTDVVLKLNDDQSLTIPSGQTGATFTFATGLTKGTAYAVTVYSYSTSTQSYVLTHSSGSVSNSNIDNVTLVFSDSSTANGNICFPAKTPVLTNKGYIHIDKIIPGVHTIRNKKIVSITKTVTNDKHLVCIEKNALGENYPSKTVYISRNHKLLCKGHMVKAKILVGLFDKVRLVPYNGEPLYNVLLEEHGKMQVHNLIVETLHPEHKVAKLYRILDKLNCQEQKDLITVYNNYESKQRQSAKA